MSKIVNDYMDEPDYETKRIIEENKRKIEANKQAKTTTDDVKSESINEIEEKFDQLAQSEQIAKVKRKAKRFEDG